MELRLVQHLVVNMDGSLPEIPACLYAYILAGNGVFVYAKRPGLETLIPISAFKIAGLPELTPQVKIAQRVPASLMADILHLSQQAFPNEVLFWFNWNDRWSTRSVKEDWEIGLFDRLNEKELKDLSEGDEENLKNFQDLESFLGWSASLPEQTASMSSTVPRDRYDEAGTRALIDLHSHAKFSSLFSHTDDEDETSFRIYAVIGNVDKAPTITVRVGVYSHYFNIPASTVFELPDGIRDIYEQEEIEYENQ